MANLDAKWLIGIHPHDTLTTAARAGLLARLHAVYALAPLAIHFGLRHGEYVHQLRVATRRAHVAFRTFHEVVPGKQRRRWMNRLRTVRRQAGPARDLDVILDRWRDAADPPPNSRALLSLLRCQRHALQEALHDHLAAHAWDRDPHEWVQLLDHIRWRGEGEEPVWAIAAFDSLQSLMQAYLRAGQRLLAQRGGTGDVARLHAFRIQSKRARYRFELCSGIFTQGSHRILLRRLTNLQQRLGGINDYAVGIRHMKRWLRKDAFFRVRKALQCWIDREQMALHEEVRRFDRQFTAEEWERIRRAWQGCKPALKLPRARKRATVPKRSPR